MPIVRVSGDISQPEISELIKKTYPGRKIKVSLNPPSSARSSNSDNSTGYSINLEECGENESTGLPQRKRILATTPRGEIEDTERSSSDKLSSRTTSSGISTSESFDSNMKIQPELQAEVGRLQKILDTKNAELNVQSEALSKAIAAVQLANKQQQELFDDFVTLRKKYDEQKNTLMTVLWEHTSKFHPALSYIPRCENMKTFRETDEVVGEYRINEVLGEGQFAIVKSCQKINDDDTSPLQQRAIKIIKKEKLLNFMGLTRMNTEIEILRKLQGSKSSVQLYDVFQTPTNLYLVTEKGGVDLFEFFDEYPNGVQEHWTKTIIYHLLRAVKVVHDRGYCHRDLKPENILLEFNEKNTQGLKLKLCDFGLCTRSTSLLTDFCGSPGFFAPEMIINGIYRGDEADIWSCGCVLLELVLGHERFCEHWMVAYDYDNLQDTKLFMKAIHCFISSLGGVLSSDDCGHISKDLKDFILRFFVLDPSERPTLKELLADPWLDSEGLIDDVDGEAVEVINVSENNSAASTPRTYTSPPTPKGPPPSTILHQDTEKKLKGSCSVRERKMLDEFNQGQALKLGIPSSDNFSTCQLPPLDPATPSIKSALKKMFKMTSSPSSSPPPQNGKYDDESVSQHSSDDGLGIGVEGIDKINLYE